MMRGPKVSLVLVSKNEEENTRRFFKALAHQTKKPDEIVLVDSSTDNTAKIAKPFVDKLIVAKTKCAGDARNIGVKNSKGDIIVFTDIDCEPHKDWLEQLLRPFSDQKVKVAQGQVFLKTYDGTKDRWMFTTGLKPEGKYLNHCNTAYRREVLEEFPMFDDISWDDVELSYRVAKKYIIYGNKMAKVYHYGALMDNRFKTNRDILDYTVKYSIAYVKILMKYKNLYWFSRIWFNIFASFFLAPNKRIGLKVFLIWVPSFFYALLLESVRKK